MADTAHEVRGNPNRRLVQETGTGVDEYDDDGNDAWSTSLRKGREINPRIDDDSIFFESFTYTVKQEEENCTGPYEWFDKSF